MPTALFSLLQRLQPKVQVWILSGYFGLLLIVLGVVLPAAHATTVKGLWVRPTAYTQEAIDKQAAEFEAAGITDIFLESYYMGQTIFPSQTMETYKLPVQHPQFRGNDIVAYWIKAAHEHHMKLHVWLQVYYAGNKAEFLEDRPFGPILTTYPAWSNRLYGRAAEQTSEATTPVASQVESGHYFLDPANPDVQTYLQTLITEVMDRYPSMDGLQLDYIRYPSALPLSNPSYTTSTWGYTPAAWKEFVSLPTVKANAPKQWQQLSPTHTVWPQWVQYRKSKVSKLVQWVSDEATKRNASRTAPLTLTAVIFQTTDPTKAQKCQAYPEWIANNWINVVVPIGLSSDPAQLSGQLKALKAELKRPAVWVGNFDLYNRRPTDTFKENLVTVEAANLDGVVLFESSRLAPEYIQALNPPAP